MEDFLAMRRGASLECDGHILIGGVGRAGTTLLVQWFTALGFETGYTMDEAMMQVDRISASGLEHALRGELEYVSKSPWYSINLGRSLSEGSIKVQACIVPIRELYEAAESRREVSRRATAAGLDPDNHPGGVSFRAKAKPGRQEDQLGKAMYRHIRALAQHSVPTYLLPFPEFTRPDGTLYRALEPLLKAHGVTQEESGAALDRVLRPDLIHAFDRDRGA